MRREKEKRRKGVQGDFAVLERKRDKKGLRNKK